MTKVPIYTIGYGNRSIEDFAGLLQHYGIRFLVDIRSEPYSRFKPDFSKEALERCIKEYRIRYLFMGNTLGGRPKDSTCYVDGKVDYAKISEKPFYQQGISYLHNAWKRQLSIALMCSEAKPQECHRSKLIGNTLLEHQIDVVHIDEAGEAKTQEQINLTLTGGQPFLFNQESLITLNKKIGLSRKKHSSAKEST